MRNKSIDGLRSSLALIIVFFHYYCRFNQIYFSNCFLGFRYLGVIGGETFMILSCYLLTKEYNDNFRLIQYIKRKFFRLYPRYFLSITFTMICLHIFYLPNRTVSLKDYFYNILFINGYLQTPYVDSAHWYIFTLFSAILVVGLLKKLHIFDKFLSYICWMCFAYIIFKSKFIGSKILYNILGGNYIGIICAGLSLGRFLNSEYISKIYLLKFGGIILCSFLYTYVFKDTSSTLLLIPALVIVWSVVNFKIKFLQNKFFLHLSKLSYSLYLIHQNIGYSLEYMFILKFGKEYLWLYGIVSFMIVLNLSYLIELIIKNLEKISLST